jgi:hypothetical protein
MSSLEKMRLLQDAHRRKLQQIEEMLAKRSRKYSEDHAKVQKEKELKHKQEVKLQRAPLLLLPVPLLCRLHCVRAQAQLLGFGVPQCAKQR